MSVAERPCGALLAGSRDDGRRRAVGHYAMYGLCVASELPLPLPEVRGRSRPSWTFRRASAPAPDLDRVGPPLAQLRCRHGLTIASRYDGTDGIWLSTTAATFLIRAADRVIDVHPSPDVDHETLGIELVAGPSLFMLHQLGHPSLHASAVVTERGAIAFLGASGAGKTTMASSFLRRGATLLSDDALPLETGPDGVYGRPGPPLLKVWRETAEHTLGLSEELPNVSAHQDKKLIKLHGRYPFAASPARLQRIYLLGRYGAPSGGPSGIAITPLHGRDAFTTLVAHSSMRPLLTPREAAVLLPLHARLAAQVRVRRLEIPDGFAHHEAVCERIMQDVELS